MSSGIYFSISLLFLHLSNLRNLLALCYGADNLILTPSHSHACPTPVLTADLFGRTFRLLVGSVYMVFRDSMIFPPSSRVRCSMLLYPCTGTGLAHCLFTTASIVIKINAELNVPFQAMY